MLPKVTRGLTPARLLTTALYFLLMCASTVFSQDAVDTDVSARELLEASQSTDVLLKEKERLSALVRKR